MKRMRRVLSEEEIQKVGELLKSVGVKGAHRELVLLAKAHGLSDPSPGSYYNVLAGSREIVEETNPHYASWLNGNLA
ncbi:MAG: hypothetical protein Q7J22_00540 [Candidatus Wolfebacteria bacterium]|nr:hypothetical protein [Candidatus Wolfebacteria bacterium]MDP2704675.1 hypothetical protein [bacterium]